ncbi:MAG: HD domain-containing protein [Candidatus Nanohaloarchaea archaeon]|nr:HD domain-containing protein [Candidatus Nanohaloarchaea archaeon]
METLTLPYRYLNGGEPVTEYEDVQLDHDEERLELEFRPVRTKGGRELDGYLNEPDYLEPIDQVDDPEQELLQRLPELGAIEDDENLEAVIDTYVDDCPDSYWIQPASGSGNHHPPDERGVHGQWIHTKRMLHTYSHLARSAEEMEEDAAYSLDEDEIQNGLVAAAVHDIHKFGVDGGEEMAVPDHDVTAAKYVREQTDLPDKVADAVKAHNGPWGEGKTPETDTEAFVHLADMDVAATASEKLLERPTPALKFAQLTAELVEYDEDLASYEVIFR